MRRIAAHRLVSEVPPELDALLVRERSPEGPLRRLCAAGDIGLSGRIAPPVDAGHDPFCDVAPVLRSAELAFANLETPIVDAEPGARLFAAPPAAAPLLARAGFGLVNLANNHVLDHGCENLAATRQALLAAGIEVVGAGEDARRARRLVVTDLGGLEVGWLASARTHQPQAPSDPGFWEYDPEALRDAVRAARQSVDVLVVSIHMGYMYLDVPDPEQRARILALLEGGADLVVVHHAHVLQGVESTESGGLACYNLGNLLLDWEEGVVGVEEMLEEQRSGGLFVFDLDRRGVARAAVLPVYVDDGWTIRWALGERGERILGRLERISEWTGDLEAVFLRQRAERNTDLALRSVVAEAYRGGPRAAWNLLRRIRPQHVRILGRWLGNRLSGARPSIR